MYEIHQQKQGTINIADQTEQPIPDSGDGTLIVKEAVQPTVQESLLSDPVIARPSGVSLETTQPVDDLMKIDLGPACEELLIGAGKLVPTSAFNESSPQPAEVQPDLGMTRDPRRPPPPVVTELPVVLKNNPSVSTTVAPGTSVQPPPLVQQTVIFVSLSVRKHIIFWPKNYLMNRPKPLFALSNADVKPSSPQ